MKIMSSRCSMLMFVFVLSLVLGAGGLFAQAPQLPESLAGTWILNVEKSELAGPPPKSHYRTFDFSHDGMLLCTYGTVNAQGRGSFGFWEAKLDNSDAKEFSRRRGATPSAILNAKKVDSHSIYVTAKRDGKLFATVTFFTSNDGKNMTQDITIINEEGEKVRNVRVYDKQPGRS